MLVTLKGTHGTLDENKEAIEENGFIPGVGRLGKGVYFWKMDRYATELAMAWVHQRYPAGRKGIVLSCKINIDEDKALFNIDDRVLKEEIFLTAEAAGLDVYNESDICAAHDLFFREYEKDTRQVILVVEGETFPPASQYFIEIRKYPAGMLGNPVCYAVRDERAINVENASEPFETKGGDYL